MEPAQDLNAFFNGARQALTELSELNAETAKLRDEKTKLENSVNSRKRKLEDTLNQTYEKRRAEIDKTYDGEISKCNEKLKKAKGKREKAKNQGIRERISEETAALRSDIKSVESSIRSEFKRSGIPGLCNNSFYFSLFMPGSFKDILVIILTFAIAFFLIPFGIWKLFFDGSSIALFIIYVLDVLLFGGLYIIISQRTVMRHQESLKRIRRMRKQIADDRRKINDITDNIRNDANESHYDLAAFDDEIAHLTQQLADITMQKNDAIHKFENVTKNIITEEITNNARPAIDEESAKLAEVSAKYSEADTARKTKALEINNNYEVYLGKEFMTKAKIDALADIINHGTATNISEAIEEYYRQNDI